MSPRPTLSLSPRPPAALGVAAAHVLLLLLLLQTDVLERFLPEAPPVPVTLLSAAAHAPAAPAPLPATPLSATPRPQAPALPFLAPPPVEWRSPPTPAAVIPPATPSATPPATAPDEPARAPEAASLPTTAAPTVQAGPASPPAAVPTEPRQVSPGAISYRVAPAVTVPLASRRLRESGTVWLRVRVDRQGLPVQVGVHRSSGFPRLDEQALVAMQAARFVPQTENGIAIDWVVIAPLAYDID